MGVPLPPPYPNAPSLLALFSQPPPFPALCKSPFVLLSPGNGILCKRRVTLGRSVSRHKHQGSEEPTDPKGMCPDVSPASALLFLPLTA